MLKLAGQNFKGCPLPSPSQRTFSQSVKPLPKTTTHEPNQLDHNFIQDHKSCRRGIQPNLPEGENSFTYWYILQILFSQSRFISCIAARRKYRNNWFLKNPLQPNYFQWPEQNTILPLQSPFGNVSPFLLFYRKVTFTVNADAKNQDVLM